MDVFGISSYPKKYRRGSTFNIPVKARKGARKQDCCRTRGIDCGEIRVFEADFFFVRRQCACFDSSFGVNGSFCANARAIRACVNAHATAFSLSVRTDMQMRQGEFSYVDSGGRFAQNTGAGIGTLRST